MSLLTNMVNYKMLASKLLSKLQSKLKLLKDSFFKKGNKYSKIDQLRYLSQSVLIEETAAPYVVRTTLFFISLVILALIFWAGVTDVEEIAITQGEVVPSKHVQSIQHLEGGIVSEIKVVEGELVQEDQPIFILEGAAVRQDLSALKAKQVSLEYKIVRLRAFIDNKEPNFDEIELENPDRELGQEQIRAFESMMDAKQNAKEVIIDQIVQKKSALAGFLNRKVTLESNLSIAKEEVDLKTKLYEKGHLSKLDLLKVQRQFNDIKDKYQENDSDARQAENAIAEYQNRLESLEANFLDEAYSDLEETERNLVQVQETIKKLEEQVERLSINSPSYGYVKVLNVKTIGAVVESGEILAEVVPLEGNLIIEIQINPKDIGHVRKGQPVNVKVSAYDPSRYGSILGSLQYISATTFVNNDGTRYYMGRVSIDKNYVGKDSSQNLIVPGMTVQADIVTGSKSILEYLLKPIHTSVTTAFSER